MQIGVVNQSQVNHQFKKIMLKYVPAALSITAVGTTRIPLIKALSFTGQATEGPANKDTEAIDAKLSTTT